MGGATVVDVVGGSVTVVDVLGVCSAAAAGRGAPRVFLGHDHADDDGGPGGREGREHESGGAGTAVGLPTGFR